MQKKSSNIIDLKDLNFFFKIIKKNWWIAVIFLILAYIVYRLYVYKLPVIQSVSTQLLLKSNDEYNPSSVISDNSGSFYGKIGKTYIDNSNESQVIKSFDLISSALDKLDFGVSYYIVGRINTLEVYSGLPFHVEAISINPNLLERQLKFRFKDVKSYTVSYRKGEEDVVKTGTFDEDLVATDFRIRVRAAENVNAITINNLKNIEYLFQVHDRYNLISKYVSQVMVKNPDYTNILQLSINDVIPERAARFLDTLSNVYIQNTLKTRYEINEKTLFYIDKQMKEVVSVLDNIEDTMQAFKEEKAILDIGKEGEDYYNKMVAAETKKSKYEMELVSLEELEKYIIEDKDTKFLPPSVYTIADPFLSRSALELYSTQIKRNSTMEITTANNPDVVEADRRIEVLKKDLLISSNNVKKAIHDRILSADEKIAENITKLKTLPVKQRGLVNIQRNLSVNENMYVFLLQKRANTIISKASIIPQTKVIELARPMEIVSPNKSKLLNIFLSCGLGIALLVILIRAVFFEKVETQGDLKSMTTLPILGEVYWSPDIGDLQLAIEKDPRSVLSESFRSLRTNLQFFGAPDGAKVIVISSTSPGEGKTFCTLNVAATLAMAGKRVLILELDLHKPRVQKGLGLEPVKGITTFIIGKDKLEDCIVKSHIENMDVILSGPLPPNPSELILSPKMDEILEFGRKNYDYVFIDTPPIGLISDGFILMKKADISLFVLNSKIAYRRPIQEILEVIENNKFSNFAFILNGVKKRKSPYYYKYGYGYKYSYGYGEKEKNA